jgi:hypothetical protein
MNYDRNDIKNIIFYWIYYKSLPIEEIINKYDLIKSDSIKFDIFKDLNNLLNMKSRSLKTKHLKQKYNLKTDDLVSKHVLKQHKSLYFVNDFDRFLEELKASVQEYGDGSSSKQSN